jgi:hypothetical protein
MERSLLFLLSFILSTCLVFPCLLFLDKDREREQEEVVALL